MKFPFRARLFAATVVVASCAFAAAFALRPKPARADVQLAALWSDGIVLQRDAPIPIWGLAAPGESVSVTLGKSTQSAVAGDDGQWTLKLPAMSAASGLKMTVKGQNTVEISDVAVGEVWLASGQSNMELRVPRTLNADQEIAAGNFPLIRQFRVGRSIDDKTTNRRAISRASGKPPRPQLWATSPPSAIISPATCSRN